MTRRPMVTIAVTIFVVICGMAVYMATEQSQIFTVLTIVILYASLSKFYFPTRYIMNEHGIAVKTLTQKLEKPWSMYRSYYPDKNGVLLSPFVEPTRLENFRGLFILFNNNRDEVIAFLKLHVKPDNEPVIIAEKKADKK